MNQKEQKKQMRKISVGLVVCSVLLCSCSMILQPTTSFDRRMKASSYGTILNQTNPDCKNCTDRFLVKKPDGAMCTVVVRYDGTVNVLE